MQNNIIKYTLDGKHIYIIDPYKNSISIGDSYLRQIDFQDDAYTKYFEGLKNEQEEDEFEDQDAAPQIAVEEKKDEEPLIGKLMDKKRPKHLFSAEMLKDLYIHGRQDFVMRILLKLHAELKADAINTIKLKWTIVGSELCQEIDRYVSSVVEPTETKDDAKKKVKQSNDFDDFFGNDDDDDDDFDLMGDDGGMIDFDNLPPQGLSKPKEKEKKKTDEELKEEHTKEESAKLEQDFLKVFPELVELLQSLLTPYSQELMQFCITFRDVYHKEFFSDYMANILLRRIYFVTLIPDVEKYKV